MKSWMQKIAEQFDLDWNKKEENQSQSHETQDISNDRATLIFILDHLNKHLIDIDTQPVRKTRELIDELMKQLLSNDPRKNEKLFFRVRQFFSSHRLDEYTYIKKTFDDFRGIIWDLVDQLSEDFVDEENEDKELKERLDELRDAVEANSIDKLKNQSRLFIDTYIEFQNRKENRREFRMDSIRKNLVHVKKQLTDAHESMNVDHLTKAYNRKNFDEKIKQLHKYSEIQGSPVCLFAIDIDHFKKINDRFGHPIGDFCLIECVRMLNEIFHRQSDYVARIGGEEFVVLLPDYNLEMAVEKAQSALNKIKNEVFVKDDMKINFTISIGIAQLGHKESIKDWMKRADDALYESKNTGRNKYTVAPQNKLKVA